MATYQSQEVWNIPTLKDSFEMWSEAFIIAGPVGPTEVVVHATPLKDMKLWSYVAHSPVMAFAKGKEPPILKQEFKKNLDHHLAEML